jgi:nucleotide-binding universal stress UspA family protein
MLEQMLEQDEKQISESEKASQCILVGFDVLTDATDALRQALAFATLVPKTHVEVAWVPPIAYAPVVPEVDMSPLETLNSDVSPLETLNKRVKEVLADFGLQALEEADVRVSSIIGEGRPAQALSRIAFLHGAQMIIVGSHDKTTSLERFLLGSVARRLVAEAPCPVLVMRPLSTEAVPEIEKPLEENQARRRIGLGHRYHAVSRNVQARENMPLLFPMERR